MEIKRCDWVTNDELYIKYHDEEWGKPVYDDETIFEFLVLESFQAGLSWFTILKKRENFRAAFDQFNYKKIANYNPEKLESLMQDAGIVRNKLKILAPLTTHSALWKFKKNLAVFLNIFGVL